jgi:methyl-accepting chemotaxis protein
MKIAHKVALALAIPSLLLMGFAGYNLYQKWDTRQQITAMQTRVGDVAKARDLIHELQRERGASAVFLGSKGAQMRSELAEQRRITDEKRQRASAALEGFAAVASGNSKTVIGEAIAAISALEEKRGGIDSMAISADAASAYFTETIAKTLAVAIEAIKLSADAEISRAATAFISFTQGKEEAGKERANGAPGFAAGKFEIDRFIRVQNFAATQGVYFTAFQMTASQEQRENFRRIHSGPSVDAVARHRETLASGGLSGDLKGLDGKSWYDATTGRINLFKTVEDGLSQDMIALAASRYAAADRALLLMGAIIAFVLIASIGSLIFVGRSITRPIKALSGTMTRLVKGDATAEIDGHGRSDEIGEMAGAVQAFKDNMIRTRELEAGAEANKSRAEADRKRAMAEMADQFEAAVGGIVRTVSDAATELQTAAQALSSSSSQTTHQSTIVAAASEEAAANVRTVAAAAEELSGSVREISRQVSASASMANKAVLEAQSTNAQVSGLSAGAQKIGAIVDLINDIASKTNLLALNATIEAARAGEAGRGFAVVASEVKALAEQTSKATAEITGHISGVQSSTDQAASAILGIGRTIDEINHIASTIAAAVEEQGSATEEIARNVDQAAQGTTEVTRNISGVNHAAESASASAGQVLSSASELASQSEKLRREMQRFLATVRAA